MKSEQFKTMLEPANVGRQFKIGERTLTREFANNDDKAKALELSKLSDAKQFPLIHSYFIEQGLSEHANFSESHFQGLPPSNDYLPTLDRLTDKAPEMWFDFSFSEDRKTDVVESRLGRVVGIGVHSFNGRAARNRYNGDTVIVAYVENNEDYGDSIGKMHYKSFKLDEKVDAQEFAQRLFIKTDQITPDAISPAITGTASNTTINYIGPAKLAEPLLEANIETDPKVEKWLKNIGDKWSLFGKIPPGIDLPDGVPSRNDPIMKYHFHDSGVEAGAGISRFGGSIDTSFKFRQYESAHSNEIIIDTFTSKSGQTIVQFHHSWNVTTQMQTYDLRLVDTDEMMLQVLLPNADAQTLINDLQAKPTLLSEIFDKKFGNSLPGQKLTIAKGVFIVPKGKIN